MGAFFCAAKGLPARDPGAKSRLFALSWAPVRKDPTWSRILTDARVKR